MTKFRIVRRITFFYNDWLFFNDVIFTQAEKYLVHNIALHAGLCEPEKKLLELHQMESCSKSPTMASDD